ncbi:TetR/AcrR family transcriptional regulator [Streptomyces mangrovisoli]|uniref:TetR family transcriptional regulator n=1 Tax=Streptomyces mangrovisoli TaxID=1428628 RepID=A0A1J4NST5_9ACTN|nr:TetR/AcrR family transcriptional regulator [Streptomyces mangrovisoli]OIJ65368.1 TetR family transcriptional regulator [Streptomyces mangrovisoli]
MAGAETQRAERGPGRPRQERVTDDTLDAVIELVTEKGVKAVTMDAVAARAGVSKPAIYRRWPSKQALIIAAAESRIGPLTVPDLGDIRAELREVLTARLTAYRLPGTARLLTELMTAAAEAGGPQVAYGDYTERIMSETRRILQRGIARGEVRPEVDIRSAATLVAAPLVYRLLAERELPNARFVDDLVDMVVRAVGP